MRIFYPVLVIGLLLSTLGACGGGGSSESRILNLDGTWRGTLPVFGHDGCFTAGNSLNEIHQVSIDGDDVTLISTDGRILEGQALSTDSFEVSITDRTSFPVIDEVTYSNIANDTATVQITHIWSRPGGCVTTWRGTMKRD